MPRPIRRRSGLGPARSRRGRIRVPETDTLPPRSVDNKPDPAPSTPTLWWRLTRAPVIIGTAMLASIGSLLVSLFAPGIIEAVQNKEPVVVIVGQVVTESKTDWKGGIWAMVTPQKLDPADAPRPGSTCDDAKVWITALGGASLGETRLKLLVQGQKASGIIIKSMQAKVLERTEPLSGAEIVCPSAGTQSTIGVGFDLDSPHPVARTLSDVETYPVQMGEPYFDNYFVTLAAGEPVEFSIIGTTTKSFVRWVIEMVIVVDGKERTVTAGDDGFRTTALGDIAERWEWDWSRDPQRLVGYVPCPSDPSTFCPKE
jgi:hypothetical protein